MSSLRMKLSNIYPHIFLRGEGLVRNRICVFVKEMVTRRLIFWGFLVPKSSKGTGTKFGYYLTTLLAAGFKYFLFSPRNLGKIPNLTDIFQMG